MVTKTLLAGAAVLGITTFIAVEAAQAQFRMPPMPGPMRMVPQLAMPAINGASRFGWNLGRQDSIRRLGPMGDPGRWPGLAPSLGIRRW